MKIFKKTSILLCVFIAFFSCKKDLSKQISKRDSLNVKVKTYQEELKELDKDYTEAKNDLSQAEKTKDSGLSRTYFKTFVANTYLAEGKEEFINKVYRFFNLSKSNDIGRTLTNNLYSSEPCSDCSDKKTSLNIATFSRDKKHLEHFFDDETINKIASFFYGNKIYDESGAKSYVEHLLLAYESMEYGSESYLEDLYAIASSKEGHHSDKVEDIMSEIDGVGNRGSFIYLFWARRHHEKNMEITYALLKKVHQAITNPTDNNIENTKEDEDI